MIIKNRLILFEFWKGVGLCTRSKYMQNMVLICKSYFNDNRKLQNIFEKYRVYKGYKMALMGKIHFQNYAELYKLA